MAGRPRVLAESRCRASLLICRTFALSLCSRVSCASMRVEANWSVVAGENDNEPCHAPRCRLPDRRPNLLICRSFRERMKGLEPSTFCMANASDRSLLFASVRSSRLLSRFPIGRANASEPERTLNLAILATGLRHALGWSASAASSPAVSVTGTRGASDRARTDTGSSFSQLARVRSLNLLSGRPST
jgi:hypothetical protein